MNSLSVRASYMIHSVLEPVTWIHSWIKDLTYICTHGFTYPPNLNQLTLISRQSETYPPNLIPTKLSR